MPSSGWSRVIGIVGGLGPHAHLEFERRLLEAVGEVERDQDYPEWIISSIPATPDRTAALVDGGPSPWPQISRSLERLRAAGADFAIVACNTAHVFLREADASSILPILSIVDETIAEASRRPEIRRLGLLATTGTLTSDVYSESAARLAPDLELITPLDLPGGHALQERLVMESVYGRPSVKGRVGGVKAGFFRDPETGAEYAEALEDAAKMLRTAGADCVITGCTEISLCLASRPEMAAGRLLDPLEIAAREAVRIARGLRDPPRSGWHEKI